MAGLAKRFWQELTGSTVALQYKVNGTVNGLEIRYVLPLKRPSHPGLSIYTIMFLGETGSGKTTLMNALCNFILGVKMEDPFRYDLANELDASRYSAGGEKATSTQSLTKAVTSYWIPKRDGKGVVSCWYQFVDTPGFGDTSGLVRDERNTRLIHQFLKSENHLHAVCFVAKAGTARLTPVQRYIMEKIETLFAKDSIANTFLLATFKDAGPVHLRHTVDAAKFKYNKQHSFNFNNCALYTSGPEQVEEDQFQELFWNMCVKGAASFLTTIMQTPAFSLHQTKEVHKLRERKQQCLQNLEEQVKVNLRVVTKIKEKQEDIKTSEAKASSNKQYDQVDIVKKKRQDPIPPGRYTTFCNECVETCHKDCIFRDDEEKKNCNAMDKDGHCQICQGKCAWHKHTNKPYTIEFDVIEVPTAAGKRYDSAMHEKGSAEAAMANFDRQLKDIQGQMESAIDQAHAVLQQLEQIAVSSRVWSMGDYLDYLIEVEGTSGRSTNAKVLQSLKDNKLKQTIEDAIAKNQKAGAAQVIQAATEEGEKLDQRMKGFKAG